MACGADRTEKQYLAALHSRYARKAARVDFLTDGVDPLTLVRKTARMTELHPRDFDEVWCVVDVDEFDLDSALRLARQHGINVVVSNRCFEYWLILHFENCESAFPTAADVERRLRRHVPHYDKTNVRFCDFEHGVGNAVERAKRRCAFGEEHRHNPSSGMWRLVEAVLPDDRAR
ncbi:RloB family protein [Saccharopolyspora rosea]|uniref:RloB family protein n=1 Tax=Saccharopolyspora rosea TaxID=524884 RepID=UPI0021DA87AF